MSNVIFVDTCSHHLLSYLIIVFNVDHLLIGSATDVDKDVRRFIIVIVLFIMSQFPFRSWQRPTYLESKPTPDCPKYFITPVFNL